MLTRGLAEDDSGGGGEASAEMNLQEMVTELERRCPGCSFTVEPGLVRIVEYGRRFIVDLHKLGETAEQWFQSELDRRPIDEIPPLELGAKYRVICSRCGPVVIGYGGYHDQMRQENALWFCPACGGDATFDDETYESFCEDIEEPGIRGNEDNGAEPCPYCGGLGCGIVGLDWECQDAINGPYDNEIVECPYCHGSGKAKDVSV